MRVQTEEWRRFISGVRMYKGKRTLFYNGEILYDGENDEYLIYSEEEQQSWEVIIVLPGVEVIPEHTFSGCTKLETVIMADTVRRIERGAFSECKRLRYVRLSRNLEYIGGYAFLSCTYLTSISVPLSCREIGYEALALCKKLIIFNVSRQTRFGENVIANTALIEASPFKTCEWGRYIGTDEVNQWIQNVNEGETYELHRACSSLNPSMEIIYGIVKRRGLSTFQKKNQIGMTALDCLEANPYVENKIDQRALMKRYVMEMMGEAV